MTGKIAIIRTSDRSTFSRCRRKWGLSSHLRHNRAFQDQAQYFWFGTGGHYALEDYHGYNYYKHPAEAFRAYVQACKSFAAVEPSFKLPIDIGELTTLGESMMDYYLEWLSSREPLQTLWVDGVPQCEVKCELTLPIQPPPGYDEVRYQLTIDRMVVIDGELWIVDYKFYGRDWSSNLDFDKQCSAYIWAANTMYEKPVRGMIMQKHFKTVPEPPRILTNGRISTDKNQNTTYRLYKEALEEVYVTTDAAPLANRECLQELMQAEGIERDAYIQRDRTERSLARQEATGEQILMEVADMINPELPLYKNDTKDCSWDCSFSDICLMMDEGVNWEEALLESTVNREEVSESWRMHLPHLQSQR